MTDDNVGGIEVLSVGDKIIVLGLEDLESGTDESRITTSFLKLYEIKKDSVNLLDNIYFEKDHGWYFLNAMTDDLVLLGESIKY